MVRRLLQAALVLACARPATAQEFFPRFDFHLDAAYLASDDDRFSWDADFGGELDVIDWRAGRATFAANYEVVLGNQFRRFDPNQSNYLLEGSISHRVRGIELATVFHHISRHLSDRPKRSPIDWNMLGVRARTDFSRGRLALRTQLDARGVLKKSYVDYNWELEWNAGAEYPLRSHVTLTSGAHARLVGVDDTRERDAQVGGKAEAGVRVTGGAGALEFFVALERRIDPSPVQFGTATWMMAGFRLLNR